MSDERPPTMGNFIQPDDRPPRHPMCRCVAAPQSVIDRIAVETHPDLVELNAWLDNLYRSES